MDKLKQLEVVQKSNKSTPEKGCSKTKKQSHTQGMIGTRKPLLSLKWLCRNIRTTVSGVEK